MVHEFRIQSIQDATTRVIARKGMANATMQDIADEAGIAKGTIYLYFSDRDDLVEKTFGFAIGRLHAKVEEALATSGNFIDRLHLLVRSKVEFFDENREFFRIYMSLRLPDGPVERKQRRDAHCGGLYEEHIESVTRLIQEAVAAGTVRDIDARRLALFLVEGTNALIIQRLSEEPPLYSSADEAEKIVETLLHGVLAPRKGVKR
jgi:TetR/AcrR family fatty acid metabolism transcriptional regulator